MTNKEALTKAYKILSPYSDDIWWEFDGNLIHLSIITKYANKNNKIFDAGCGLGVLALSLKLLGYNIIGGDKYIYENGSDFAVNDMDRLQKIWNNYGLIVMSKDIIVDDLEDKYNVIISTATLEHQKNPKQFLDRLKYHLSDNGLIFIATPNQVHLLNRLRFLFGRSAFSSLKNFFESGDKFIGHWREYTIGELKNMFEWLDLDIIFAKSLQDTKPRIKIRNIRDIYINIIRLISYLVPESGGVNIIIGRKK